MIDFRAVQAELPAAFTITAVTLAELAAGPHAAKDPLERARRQHTLQWAEATFNPLPFDDRAARTYGSIVAAVLAAGRKPQRRAYDLLIAAIALSQGLPLVTRNASDFAGLGLELLEV